MPNSDKTHPPAPLGCPKRAGVDINIGKTPKKISEIEEAARWNGCRFIVLMVVESRLIKSAYLDKTQPTAKLRWANAYLQQGRWPRQHGSLAVPIPTYNPPISNNFTYRRKMHPH